MGYQNNSRPKKKSTLILDIACDLDDLEDYIDNDRGKEQLLSSISYIKQSYKKLQKKLRK